MNFEFPELEELELDEGSAIKFLDRISGMWDIIVDAYYLSYFNERAKSLINKFKRELKALPDFAMGQNAQHFLLLFSALISLNLLLIRSIWSQF